MKRFLEKHYGSLWVIGFAVATMAMIWVREQVYPGFWSTIGSGVLGFGLFLVLCLVVNAGVAPFAYWRYQGENGDFSPGRWIWRKWPIL